MSVTVARVRDASVHLADQPGAGDDRHPDVDPLELVPWSMLIVRSKLPGRAADHPCRDTGRVLDRREVEQLLELADLSADGTVAVDLALRAASICLRSACVLAAQLADVGDAVDPVARPG